MYAGYIEAPVTIDNSDWIFAAAYDSLLKTGNTLKLKELGNEYVKAGDFMDTPLGYNQG